MTSAKVWMVLVSLCAFITTSLSLDCYQCSGTDPSKPFQCNEWLNDDIDIVPEPCDQVYNAKYCIKHTGRFEVTSLKCYRCSASKSLDCSDVMIHMGGIEPQGCDDVFEAQYCIKSTSLDGGIGAKRFCSSLDLGNYCNYVKQPGDTLTYRTCIYTCTGDGCNSSKSLTPSIISIVIGLFTLLTASLSMRLFR